MSKTSQDGKIQRFEAGSILVREGERSRKMFVIREGKARVYKTYLNKRVTLAILGKGEVFGELSFFDAEPRSASVETLTELEALVLDGEKAEKEIEGLPNWIFPILRSTFDRFREADRKITVLQSVNEYKKLVFKTDLVAQTIYLELLRFIKTLKMLYKSSAGAPVSSTSFYRELDEVLGERKIGLRIFWKELKENDLIDNTMEEKSGLVVLDESAVNAWEDYLLGETNNERFLMLSHTAVAILRRIVGFTRSDPNQRNGWSMSLSELKLTSTPFLKEGLEELDRYGVLKIVGTGFTGDPANIQRHFIYQDLLKAFDHTTMSVD
jgi:CRP/FNR family cyclic AMP-dependent transcriptional regulator